MKEARYKLLEAQSEFLHVPANSQIDKAIYQGGYGSGKTFIGSFLSVFLCLRYAGIKGIIGALDYSLLEKTTIDSIRNHLTTIGMEEEVHYKFSKRGSRLEFMNGSMIDFIHLKDFETFKSMECAFFEIEECSQVEWDVIKHTFGRLRQPKKLEWGDNFVYRWFGHTNIGGKRGWIYKYFVESPIDNSRLIKASTLQNTYLSPVYINSLMSVMTKDEVNQFIHGNDMDFDSTLMFPYFGDDNIIESYNKDIDKYFLCCDFNVNPMCWYICVKDEDNFVVVDEYIGNDVTTEEMCALHLETIVAKYGKNIYITGDATGRSRKTNGKTDYAIIFNAFNDLGITPELLLLPKNPDKAERLSKFGGMIMNALGVRRLSVVKSCVKLIYNMYNLERNMANNQYKEPTSEMIKRNPDLLYLCHPIDAVSYWVYNVLSNIC